MFYTPCRGRATDHDGLARTIRAGMVRAAMRWVDSSDTTAYPSWDFLRYFLPHPYLQQMP
ncbi:MAG TPA: hypothetical protein VGN24_04885 [Rhodanobacter sp.]|jgi:hypothetical protein|nr:hypothetical protein [Rhodanobacter sp.]